MPKQKKSPYSIQEGLRRTKEVNARIVDSLYLGNPVELVSVTPIGFIAQTQCHANVLNLPQAKSGKSKVFWTFIVALAVTGLIIELFHVMTRYIKSPKASEINIKSENSLVFPAVVLCNLNPINKTYLSKNNISLGLAHHAQLVYALMKNVPAEMEKSPEETRLLDQQLDQLLTTYKDRDLRHFFYDAGHWCQEFLTACSFQWTPFNCCEVAEEIFDIHFGKCFLIDSGRFHQLYPAAGLQIKVKVSRTNAAPSFGPSSRGVAIRIMDHYDPSVTESTLLGLGKHAAVQIEQVEHIYLNTFMKTVCRKSRENMQDFAAISNANYTYNQCIGLCFNQEAMRACNCTYPQDRRMFGSKKSKRICTPSEAKFCLKMKVEAENSPAVKCTRRCLPACAQVQYRITTSAADLFSPDEEENIQLMESAVIDIHFTKIQTTIIQEIYIVTADGLISQIGGLLGIFLGASLITAVQLIIFCINFTYRLFRNCVLSLARKRKGSRTHSEPREDPDEEPMSPSNQQLMSLAHAADASATPSQATLNGQPLWTRC